MLFVTFRRFSSFLLFFFDFHHFSSFFIVFHRVSSFFVVFRHFLSFLSISPFSSFFVVFCHFRNFCTCARLSAWLRVLNILCFLRGVGCWCILWRKCQDFRREFFCANFLHVHAAQCAFRPMTIMWSLHGVRSADCGEKPGFLAGIFLQGFSWTYARCRPWRKIRILAALFSRSFFVHARGSVRGLESWHLCGFCITNSDILCGEYVCDWKNANVLTESADNFVLFARRFFVDQQ